MGNPGNQTYFYMGVDHAIPILILIFIGIAIVTGIGLLIIYTTI